MNKMKGKTKCSSATCMWTNNMNSNKKELNQTNCDRRLIEKVTGKKYESQLKFCYDNVILRISSIK